MDKRPQSVASTRGDAVPTFLTDHFIWVLVGVMLAAGVLGGTVNHVTQETNAPRTTLLRALLVGATASFLVPLFLNTISSSLLDDVRNDPSRLLVFAGLCLVAAVSSRVFTRTTSDQILNEIKQAKDDASQAKLEAGQALAAARELGTKVTEVQKVQADLDLAARPGAEPEPTIEGAEATSGSVDVDERDTRPIPLVR
jgi:uncharacterized membrane protein